MPIDRIRTVIVEDEPSAAQALEKLLALHCVEVEVVGKAQSVSEGIDLVKSLEPDLILLDIQLGKEHSFQLLESLPALTNTHIVFTTAYSEYAVEAFRFSAVDYLLKPIDADQLREAIDKVIERMKTRDSNTNLNVLIENMQSNQGQKKKLVLSTLDALHVIEIGTIIRCQSDMNYTVFYLIGGKELIISKTLKEFETQLTPYGFLRIHKSWLINKFHITAYDKTDGGYAIMQDESRVPVSDMKRDYLLKVIKETL
ncbi:MAG: response regulator transcription factor [Cyclobacteriaceae bacterium]|nr:response regulator transcription factor [Cyclobacteriaceae bacterium]